MKQTVFIVDDNLEMVQAIQSLLKSVNIHTKPYTNAKVFLDEYEEQPGCIILDVRMTEMSGLQVQQILKERNYNIPIIFITGHGDIPITKRALQEGAKDFFTKPFSNQELLDSIQVVLRENEVQYEKRARIVEMQKRCATLSPRELEVLVKIVEGYSSKIIADKLKISISTIEAHRAKIMQKMKAKTLASLVKIAVKYNIVDCE